MHEEWMKNVNEKSKQICETSVEECEELLTTEETNGIQNHVIKFDYSACRTKLHSSQDKYSLSKQIIAALFASLSSVCIGFITAYSSPALPLFNQTFTDYDEERDDPWIGSLPSIASIPGSLAGGFLMDFLGPRRTLVFTALPYILSWAFIAFAPSMPLVYVGRVITGIFLGIYSPVPQVYATEVAEPSIRGLMGAFPEAAVALGSLLCYGFGAGLDDIRWLAVASALVPGIPLFFGMLFFPESPQWLVKKGKMEKAEKSLKFFRSADHNCKAEADMIRENIESTDGADISMMEQIKLFKKSQNWKPVLIVFLVFMCGQFSGFAVVTAFMSDIFKEANTDMDPNNQAVIVGTVRFFSTLVSAMLLDRVGRKPLLVISAIGSSLGMVTLGTFFYLSDTNSNVDSLSWLPLTSLLIYVFFNELGYGPVPWLLSGELIPLAVRTIGNGVAVTAYSLFAFLIALSYNSLAEVLTRAGCFWMYSIFSLSGVFLGWYLPETRGKTLEEIEKFFLPKKSVPDTLEPTDENGEFNMISGSQVAITGVKV